MAISDADLEALAALINDYPNGVSIGELAGKGATEAQRKLIHRRLVKLIEDGRITVEGRTRATRYKPARVSREDAPVSPVVPIGADDDVSNDGAGAIPLSKASRKIISIVRQPIQKRTPVGYDRAFLESYIPNETHYLSQKQRQHLLEVGKTDLPDEPAGTFAKQVLQRLLIDLSFNSSRLEGNTYSLLDTKRLIQLGVAAQGAADKDTQMILNHKEAIDFLVTSAEYAGFNGMTIRNLHGMLSNNLLPDPSAVGRLRTISVGIGGSVFKPLDVPSIIQEVFDQILHTASRISDPFEQSFFSLVQLPYLQPFEDVNKRVSRLAANMPMIKHNLKPLSFVDVPNELYVSGMLGVYETNQLDLLRDIYLWAYERSAQQYTAIRNTLGEPDAFRLRHREAMRAAINSIISGAMGKAAAASFIETWTSANIATPTREQFRDVVTTELLALHEGNFIRYGVTPSTFAAWQQAWDGEK